MGDVPERGVDVRHNRKKCFALDLSRVPLERCERAVGRESTLHPYAISSAN